MKLLYRPNLYQKNVLELESESFDSLAERFEIICLQQQSVFEVIDFNCVQRVRAYFDVDVKVRDTSMTETDLELAITNALRAEGLTIGFIGTSHSLQKYSFHVTCKETFHFSEIKATVDAINRSLGWNLFDPAVYGRWKCMRTVHSCKPNDLERPVKLRFGTFADSLITVFPGQIQSVSGSRFQWLETALNDPALDSLWKEKANVRETWIQAGLAIAYEAKTKRVLAQGEELFVRLSRKSPQFDSDAEVENTKSKFAELYETVVHDTFPRLQQWVKDFKRLSAPSSVVAPSSFIPENVPVRSIPESSDIIPYTYAQACVLTFISVHDISTFIRGAEDLKKIASLLKSKAYASFYEMLRTTTSEAIELAGPNLKLPYDSEDTTLSAQILEFAAVLAGCDEAVTPAMLEDFLSSAEKDDQLQLAQELLLQYPCVKIIPPPLIPVLPDEENVSVIQRLLAIASVETMWYITQYPYIESIHELWEMANHDETTFRVLCVQASPRVFQAERYFHFFASVDSDTKAASVILDLYPFWLWHEDVLYLFDYKTGIWNRKKREHIAFITFFASFLYTPKKCKENNFVMFNNPTLKVVDRIGFILCNVRELRLCSLNNSALGKILFANGVWDSALDEFVPAQRLPRHAFFNANDFDRPIFTKHDTYFFARVEDDYLTDNLLDAEMYEDMLHTMFYNVHEQDLGEYHRESLALGIMGYKYKGFYVHVGEPSSGKSTEKAMLEAAFGQYCGTGSVDEFANIKEDKREGTLRNCFVTENWNRRLLFFSEGTEREVSTEMLKQHSSGGEDKIRARQRYANDGLYDIHYTMVFYVNTMFKVSNPNDPAFIERAHFFYWTKSFVDEVVDPACQLLRRAEVPTWKNDPVRRQHYARIILDAYSQFRARGFVRLPVPDRAKEFTLEQVGEVQTNDDWFERLLWEFIFDGRETSKCSSEDLGQFCDANHLDKRKVGMKITAVYNKLGIRAGVERTLHPKPVKVRGKVEKQWVGFRPRVRSSAVSFVSPDRIDAKEDAYLTDLAQWKNLMKTYDGTIPHEVEMALRRTDHLVQEKRLLSEEEKEVVNQWATPQQLALRRSIDATRST